MDLTLDLADYVQRHTACSADQRIIDRITQLLSDDIDGVRMEAAMALEDIGPPAKTAVPALKAAILRSDKLIDAQGGTVLPVNSSGSAARDAIRSISGELVPPYTAENRSAIPDDFPKQN